MKPPAPRVAGVDEEGVREDHPRVSGHCPVMAQRRLVRAHGTVPAEREDGYDPVAEQTRPAAPAPGLTPPRARRSGSSACTDCARRWPR